MARYRNKVSYLSFLLAILVVIRHAINIETYGLESGVLYWIQMFFREISDIAVPTFFIMSGYLFFQNYDPKKLKEKWKSRIFSVLIPYCVWNILAYLYYEVIYMIPLVKASMTQTIEPFNFEWLIKNMLFGYHNITWFLRNLMVYIFIVPLLFPVIRNKAGGAALLAVAFAVGIFEQNEYGFAYNGVFYLLGAYLGIHHREIVQKHYPSRYIVLALAALLLSAVLNIRFSFIGYVSRVPIRIVQVVLLWVAAEILAIEKTPKWWITISFVIYCSHSMILESVEKVLLIVLKNNMIGAAIDFVFAPVITLCIIWVASSILRKIPIVWRVLSGNR